MKSLNEIKGLHITCNKCRKPVTSKKAKCGRASKLAKNCNYKDKHKYQSRIKVGKSTKVRTWQVNDITDAITEHEKFRADINSYYQPQPTKLKAFPKTLGECMALFIDYLQDIDIPVHEKKNLSLERIKEVQRSLLGFLQCGISNSTSIYAITSNEVGLFYTYLTNTNKYARKTYNKYMQSLKQFFDWLIKYGYEIENPFEDVVMKVTQGDPMIITEEELQRLLDAITEDNSYSQKHQRHMYRDWLRAAILMFLYTGGRRDDVWYLKWTDKKENYLKIPNYKRNKRANDEQFFRNLYISRDLEQMLLKLGGHGDGYIICPESENRQYLKDLTSKAFTHFWEKSGNNGEKKLSHLRKTFATRIRVRLGDKASGLNLHTDQVAINHYLNSVEIQKEMGDNYLFDLKV